jgi:beta-lactamase superfamily II metal-dependent hydrolase
VINYLDAQDISFIDLVVISHPHADHIGQLAGIMESYDVGEVWTNGAESSSRTFQQAMEAILASDADYAEPSAGDTMEIGPLQIEVLHPGSLSGDLNKDSLSLRMVYGDISFVFTGDAYQADELEMIKRTDQLKSTFLQIGHHGSKTSSDPQFIRAVDPDAAIYSAGADNSYGHPHPEVISLMQNEGITVYGTDVHGTILISTDGKEYDVTTKEDGTISPESTGSATGNNHNQEKEKDNAETEKPDTAGDCIDINQAPEEKLQEIIHIGPVRAQDVIAQRPYDRVDDLTKVDGIGPARITDIKEEGLACTGG